MDASKTRIYRGGLRALLGQTGPRSDGPKAEAPAAPATLPPSAAAPATGEPRRRTSVPPPWPPRTYKGPPPRLGHGDQTVPQPSAAGTATFDPGTTRLEHVDAGVDAAPPGVLGPSRVALIGSTPRAVPTRLGISASPVTNGPPSPPTVSAPASLLHTTRVMPIERLLPPGPGATLPSTAELDALRDLLARRHPELTGQHAAARQPAKPKTRLVVRILGHVALGLLTLLAVAAWMLPQFEDRPSRLRSQPIAAATAPVNTDPPPSAALDATIDSERTAITEPTPPAEPAAPPARPIPTDKAPRAQRGKPRAAIDAVIAGDFATAERLYRELADEDPSVIAYREAARILSTRDTTAAR
ncbi:MAG: hypothetical protein ABW321_23820 [Polyangiales bacterium]